MRKSVAFQINFARSVLPPLGALYMTKNAFAGLLFALLWSSASVATKFSLLSAQPLVIAVARFLIAGGLALLFAYALRRYPAPEKREWRQLVIYGFLNVALYLGAFVIAMKLLSAGLGTLAVGTNPLFISLFSAWYFKKPISRDLWLGLVLGVSGVLIATYPLLRTGGASLPGLGVLLLSSISYSVATIYYSEVEWKLPRLAINGWHTLIGGVMLLPLAALFYNPAANHYDVPFWGGVFWLIFMVSIGAIQLWLYLLKVEPEKAPLWLFLCPISGFIYAAILLGEPITILTAIGAALVIAGLYIGRRTTT